MDTEADERRRLKEELFEDNKKKYQKAPKRKGPPEAKRQVENLSTISSNAEEGKLTAIHWKKEDEQKLIELWKQGFTVNNIAAKLGSELIGAQVLKKARELGVERQPPSSKTEHQSEISNLQNTEFKIRVILETKRLSASDDHDLQVLPFTDEGLSDDLGFSESKFRQISELLDQVTNSHKLSTAIGHNFPFGFRMFCKVDADDPTRQPMFTEALRDFAELRDEESNLVSIADLRPLVKIDQQSLESFFYAAISALSTKPSAINRLQFIYRFHSGSDATMLAKFQQNLIAIADEFGADISFEPHHPDHDTRTHFLADHATDQDLLGYLPYAMGIASFVRDRRTALPLTIAIDGAWGTGKSSLMKMLRNELDPDRPDEDTIKPHAGWLRAQWDTLSRTLGTLLPLGRLAREVSDGAAKLGTKFANLIAPAVEKKADETTAPDREFVTVFVNAWRHGHGTQLKATLVNEILKSLTARLGPDFLMSLNLNRIDRLAVLNSAIKGFLTNSTTLFLAVLATITLLLSGLLGFDIPVVSWDMLGVSQEVKALMHAQPHLPGGASAGAGLLLYLWKKIPAPDLKQYLQEPDYLNLMGDSAQVEADFRRILAVLKERDLHLALFVDDLDRCSPADCAAVVEALNTFFGQDKHECLFVLGMHREMVATSLEVAYCDLVAKIDGLESLAEQRPFGRRFLEKIVQFFVTLPEPGEDATRKYLDALTEGKRRASLQEIRALQKADNAQKDQPASPATSGKLRTVTGMLSNMMPWPLSRAMDSTFDTLIDRLESGNIDITQAKADAKKLSKLEEDIQERKNANENDYVAAFQEVRAVIRTNPRQYKRFFNKLRFYRLLNVAEENPMLVDAGEAVLALEHPELHARARKLPGIGSFHKLAQAADSDTLDEEAKKLLATLDGEVGVRDLREKVAAL